MTGPRRAWLLLAVAVIGLAVRFFYPPRATASQDYAEYIGARLGEAALQVVAAPQHVLVVLDGGANARNRYVAAYRRGLERTIKAQQATCTFETDEVVVDFMAAQNGAGAITGSDFQSLEQRHPNTDLIVSLAGVPAGLAKTGPPLVALAVYGAAVEPAFRSGRLQAVLLPRARGGEADAVTPAAGVEGRFAREYEVRTR